MTATDNEKTQSKMRSSAFVFFAWLWDVWRSFVKWLWSIDGRVWLAGLLVVLTIPIVANAILSRHTVFRVVVETQGFSGTILPKEVSHTISIAAENGVLCSDHVAGAAATGGGDCPGFAKTVTVPAGRVTFLEGARVQASHIDGKALTLTVMPLEAHETDECDRPSLRIDVEEGQAPSEDEIEAFLFEEEVPAEILSCGAARFTYEAMPGQRNDWIVLDGLGLTFGNDIGPAANTQTSALHSGTIEIHGFGFFSDLMRLTRSTLAPQRGYIKLSTFNVNFADVIRFEDEGGQNAPFHVSALANETGFVVSAWIIASEAIVSTYGSPGYVLRPSAIDRLLNDPLLYYWSAITLALLSLWLRATLIENLFSRGRKDDLALETDAQLDMDEIGVSEDF